MDEQKKAWEDADRLEKLLFLCSETNNEFLEANEGVTVRSALTKIVFPDYSPEFFAEEDSNASYNEEMDELVAEIKAAIDWTE